MLSPLSLARQFVHVRPGRLLLHGSARAMSSSLAMDRHRAAVASISGLGASQAHPDGHAAPLLRSYIDGTYVEYRSSAAQYTVPDASTGDVLAYMQVADNADIDKAVHAAKIAQKEWAKLSGTERGRILSRVALLLTTENDRLAELEALDTGRPIQETLVVDAVSARDCFEYFGGLAGSISGEYVDLPGGSFAYSRKEPLGVTAGIGAFNYPIQGTYSEPHIANVFTSLFHGF
jgi:betaine-aldehyde dehydrogenase